MAYIQHLGDQIIHGGQDIARTERLQRSCMARLVELSLSIAVVTHLSPFLYSVNRRQGAIPENGQTILFTWVLLQTSKRVIFGSCNSLKYRDTMLDKRVKNQFLQQNRQLSPSYRRNIRRDMTELFDWGVAHDWLLPLAQTLPDWRTKGESKTFEEAYYGRMGAADRTPYGPTKRGRVPRRRGQPIGPALPTLTDFAPELGKDLEEYFASCADPFDGRTPQKIKKVGITVHKVREKLDALAGYAVHEYGLPAELLTLRDVCDPALLRSFIPWWLKRRGRSTGGLRVFLSVTRTIAEHWLHDVPRAQQISALYDMPGLPPEQPIDDREAPWLDLEELNTIAEARHPLNARRLHDSAYAREVDFYLKHPGQHPPKAYRNKPYGSNLHVMATWAGHALMLRLLIHRPLRQRNLRELAIRDPRKGEGPWQGIPFVNNLLPQPDGSYRLHFQGDGLKVRMRRGKGRQVKINVWDESFPRSLHEQLEEWLTIWRPQLIKDPDYPFLFVSRWGDPYNTPMVSRLIEKTIWAFTQDRDGGPVAMNPHQIRHIWWTSMVAAKMDFTALVRIFGDSIKVAWENYTDVDKARKISQWTRDLAKAIEEDRD
jgi:hypothetical protein